MATKLRGKVKYMKKKVYRNLLLSGFGVALLIVYVSLTKSGYTVMVLNTALLNAIVAYGLSIMLGMGGQLVFSGIVFMGVGAYVTANLCSGRLGFYTSGTAAIVLSILVVALLSLIMGMLFLRLRGAFCTFSTIALVTVGYTLYQNYEPAFGGPKGIPNIKSWTMFGYTLKDYWEWFYVILAFTLVVAIFVEMIRNSRLGRSLSSIRDNEIAAQTLGVNIYWVRVIAYIIAGVFAGLSGSLLALHNTFISGDQFTFQKSAILVVMAMLGGINSTVGIFFGALIVSFLPEVLRGIDQQYLMLIYGIAIVLMMIFMPMGMAGIISDAFKKRRRKKRIRQKAEMIFRQTAENTLRKDA